MRGIGRTYLLCTTKAVQLPIDYSSTVGSNCGVMVARTRCCTAVRGPLPPFASQIDVPKTYVLTPAGLSRHTLIVKAM